MPWKKGAVVIKVHGDAEWANAMAMDMQTKALMEENEALRKENATLKRDNEFLKKHVTEELRNKIQLAEEEYGYNWAPPNWASWIYKWLMYIGYHIGLFIDKYLKY